jgi:transglutaminase-like putative cysteine protease
MRFALVDHHDVPEDTNVDTASLDWTQVRSTAYVIQQRITYHYEGPVRRLRQRLMVQPREHHGDQFLVSRSVRVVDASAKSVRARSDDFGNHVIDIEVPYIAERVTFISLSVVERRADRPNLAASAMLSDRRLLDFTILTRLDPDLEDLVYELRGTSLFGDELAIAACEKVFELMSYAFDVTTVRTTAAEAFAKRTGVCQDYAHVLLALTRGLGLPSRYVSGQLLGTGGSHAWVEVLVPDGEGRARVLALDPTTGRTTGMTYVTIAVGRDYADIAPVSGTYVAPHAGVLTMSKRVTVKHVEVRAGERSA